MKASTQYTLLYIVGSIFGYLGLFHSAVGLPDWVQFPCMLIFVLCVWSVVWLQRHAKKRGDPAYVPATPAQNRRYMWFLVVVLFVSCVAWPFVLPYTGVTAPFSELVITSAVIFIVFAPLIIVIRRRRERPNQSLQPTAGRSDASH
jgi:hypothetical protein